MAVNKQIAKDRVLNDLKIQADFIVADLKKKSMPNGKITRSNSDCLTFTNKGFALCKGYQLEDFETLKRFERIADILPQKSKKSKKMTYKVIHAFVSLEEFSTELSRQIVKIHPNEYKQLKSKEVYTSGSILCWYTSVKARDVPQVVIVGRGMEIHVNCIGKTEISAEAVETAKVMARYMRGSSTAWLNRICLSGLGTVIKKRKDSKGLKARTDDVTKESLINVWNNQAPHYKGNESKSYYKEAYILDINHAHLQGMKMPLNIGYEYKVNGVRRERLETVTDYKGKIYYKEDAEYLGIVGTHESVIGGVVWSVEALCDIMDDLKTKDNWLKRESPIAYTLLKNGYTRTYGICGMKTETKYINNYQNFSLIANHTYRMIVEIADILGQENIMRPATDSMISIVKPCDLGKYNNIIHYEKIYNFYKISEALYIWETEDGNITYKGERISGKWEKSENDITITYKCYNVRNECIKTVYVIKN